MGRAWPLGCKSSGSVVAEHSTDSNPPTELAIPRTQRFCSSSRAATPTRAPRAMRAPRQVPRLKPGGVKPLPLLLHQGLPALVLLLEPVRTIRIRRV